MRSRTFSSSFGVDVPLMASPAGTAISDKNPESVFGSIPGADWVGAVISTRCSAGQLPLSAAVADARPVELVEG
ncbi:hypothetical protein GS440_19175 [Rhodococcus hoagii]|nr:hypothetical protein [Prescottella equi]